jgi:hypothetical protein
MMTSSAEPASPCKAHLLTQQTGTMLTLTGECQNVSEQALSLRYELSANKRGASGTSRNTQSGRFTVLPGQKATLSQTSLSVSPADSYQVYLRLLDAQNNVVAQDSLVHTP